MLIGLTGGIGSGKSVISNELRKMGYAVYDSDKEAKRLIRDSSLNMTEISERLNFSSLHYFSRVFREKNGISPTDYAKDIK